MIKEVLDFITNLTRKPYSVFDQNGRATQVLVPDGYKPVETLKGQSRKVAESLHEATISLKGLGALGLYIEKGEEKPVTRDVFVKGPTTLDPRIQIVLGDRDSGDAGRIEAKVPLTPIYNRVFGLNNMDMLKPEPIQALVRSCAPFLDPAEAKGWLNFTLNREKRTEISGMNQAASARSILMSPEGAKYQMPNSLTFTFAPFQECLDKKVTVRFRLEPVMRGEDLLFEVYNDGEAEFLMNIENLLLELVGKVLPADFNVFVGDATVFNYEKLDPISKAFE